MGESTIRGIQWLLLPLCFGVTACQNLTPSNKVLEEALPPAENPLWKHLASTARDRSWVALLNKGDEALEWRWRTIDSATQSLDLQTFLLKDDRVGRAVVKRMGVAADRGVRIRVLLDDTFTGKTWALLERLASHPNVSLRLYNPFPRRVSNVALRELLNLGEFARLDHRMHNKAMVADNRVAIVGGRNLADEYFGKHAERNFRDMEVCLGGEAVQEVSRLFDSFWNSRWSVPYSGSSGGVLKSDPSIRRPQPRSLAESWTRLIGNAFDMKTVQLLADDPARRDPARRDEQPTQLAEELRHAVALAREEILLVSAYLIPTPKLTEALADALRRGVKVRILTNSLRSNNHLAAHSAYRKHIEELIDLGVDLYEVRAEAKDRGRYMEPPIDAKRLGLHAKVTVIDDSHTIIGSANLDPRSLKLNTEMALLVESRSLNQGVRRSLEVDFHPRNAWRLSRGADGRLNWTGDDRVLTTQPADSSWQRLEDWFLGTLPVEGEL